MHSMRQMSAMIDALQNCRALLLTKSAEIKELEAKLNRLAAAKAEQSGSGAAETPAAAAARKNLEEEVELLTQALKAAEASQTAVGQELQEEIARSRSLRQEAADKIAGIEKERVEERVKLQAAVAAAKSEVRRVLEESGAGADEAARSESLSALQLQLKEAESARDSALERLKGLEKAAVAEAKPGEKAVSKGGLKAEDLEAEVRRLKGQLEYAIRLNREIDTEKDSLVADLKKAKRKVDAADALQSALQTRVDEAEAAGDTARAAARAAEAEMRRLADSFQDMQAHAMEQSSQLDMRAAQKEAQAQILKRALSSAF